MGTLLEAARVEARRRWSRTVENGGTSAPASDPDCVCVYIYIKLVKESRAKSIPAPRGGFTVEVC